MSDASARTIVGGSPLRCPYCHASVDVDSEAWVACATCLARHHKDCWDEGSACAACGRDQCLVLSQAPRPTATALSSPAPGVAPGSELVHVERDKPGACATIAEALRAVATGGRIVVAKGSYRESLVIDRPVTIAGAAARADVVIEATGGDGFVSSAERATLERLTIKVAVRGLGHENHGAVRVTRGRLRIRDCRLDSETLAPCLAIEGAEARPHVERSTIQGKGRAVVIDQQARPTFDQCEIAGHKMAGVTVRGDAEPDFENCRVIGGLFGILVEDGAKGTFRGCEVTLSREAGIRVTTHAKPRFERCRVRDVKGDGVRADDQGEGVFVELSVLRAARFGILVERGGDPVFRHARVSECHGTGVAFRQTAAGRLEESRISENAGAGVEIGFGAGPFITRCKIRSNDGPAINVQPRAGGVVEKCELGGNVGGAWRDVDGRVDRRENTE